VRDDISGLKGGGSSRRKKLLKSLEVPSTPEMRHRSKPIVKVDEMFPTPFLDEQQLQEEVEGGDHHRFHQSQSTDMEGSIVYGSVDQEDQGGYDGV